MLPRAVALTVCAVGCLLIAAGPARAGPSQEDVFRSIQNNVGSHDSVSGKGMVGTLAVVAGLVIVAVVATQRQNRRAAAGGWGSAAPVTRRQAGPVNHPAKLVRELMREAGLTRAQVRQLEAINGRLASEDRAVEHLATLLLCPSLIAAARADAPRKAA